MRKNRTEYFPSNLNNFIPGINTPLSKREKKRQLEYKIEQEMKSNSEEFYKLLKQNLRKNEITKEIYLSKNVSNEKKLQPDLLISKIYNSDKFVHNKKRVLNKLSKENLNFLKTYKILKSSEAKIGKKTTQQEYLNDVVKLYIEKGYNVNEAGLNNNENIFKYSILNDQEFGLDINNDAVRIIKEMGNEEFMKEQKLIFDFQDELLNQKMNNKFSHPADALIKNEIKEEEDYGLDICPIRRKKKKFDLDNPEENKEKDKNQVIFTDDIIEKIMKEQPKPRPSFLYLQMKNDIKNMQKNFRDSIKMENVNENDKKNEQLVKFRDIFPPKLSLNNDSDDNQQSQMPKINETEEVEKSEKAKDAPVIIRNNTEINYEMNKDIKPLLILNKEQRKPNKKITFIKINNNNKKRMSLFDKLPSINQSLEKLQNKLKYKNFNKIGTTNYSSKKEDPKTQSNSFFKRKNRNYQTQIFKNKLISEEKKPKDNDKEIKKDLKIQLTSLINNKVTNIPIKENEFTKNMEKFKNKRGTIFRSFVNNTNNINIHGLSNHLKRIIEENNFRNVYVKNKYLKKNKFKYLISNSNLDLLSDDEDERMNVQKMDRRIENIIYDSADQLLGNHMLNTGQILG